jgi:hypothetical protein
MRRRKKYLCRRRNVNRRTAVCGIVRLLFLAVSGSALAACVAAARAEEESGGFGVKHLAFSYTGHMYLDGPALQAACPYGRPGAGRSDDDGNVWFGLGGGATVGIGGRCLVKETGLIRSFFGNDYWPTGFPVDEGPSSAVPCMVFSSGYNPYKEMEFVWGAPHQGGDKGFVILSDGNVVRKVFRNPEKGNRWWFKRIIGGGSKPLPTSKGGTVPALGAKVRGTINEIQVMPGGRIIMYTDGSFYELKGEDLVCLLGWDDYKDGGLPSDRNKRVTPPSKAVLGGDGTFYVGTYFGTGYGGKTPAVWRIVGGNTAEPVAWAVENLHVDGPGMASGGHCGHHIWARHHNYAYLPEDFLIIMAHDDHTMRRLYKGRVSSLCADGKWREWHRRNVKRGTIPYAGWFHTWAPGPNGTATGSSKAKGHSSMLTFIVTGVPYDAPTTGPLLDSKPRPWPPEGDADGKKEAK